MADPFYSHSVPPGSSSHKRSFDAMGPEGDHDRRDPQQADHAQRDNPSSSSSSAEGSRERNKRARNDSDSSYTSELDDILLATADPISPSSSGSSQSSYHSAQSTLPPTAASPSLMDVAEEDILVDVPMSESHPLSPPARPPSTFEDHLPLPSRLSPFPSTSVAVPRDLPYATYEDLTRSLERADAFDREIAPLRASPAPAPLPTAPSPRISGPRASAQPSPPNGRSSALLFEDDESTMPVDLDFERDLAEWFNGPERRDDAIPPPRPQPESTPPSLAVFESSSRRELLSSRRNQDNDETTSRIRPFVRFHPGPGPYLGGLRGPPPRHLLARSRTASDPPGPSDVTSQSNASRSGGHWRSASEARQHSSRPDEGFTLSPWAWPVNTDHYTGQNDPEDRPHSQSTHWGGYTPNPPPAPRSSHVPLPIPPRRHSNDIVPATTGSSVRSPRTTTQPQSIDEARHMPSPRLPPLHYPREGPTMLEAWARLHGDYGRDLRTADGRGRHSVGRSRMDEDVARTLRDAEVQSRRVADFVAEPVPHPRGSTGSRTVAQPSIPTSSYSTLRHALDDSPPPSFSLYQMSSSGLAYPPSNGQARGESGNDRDEMPWGTPRNLVRPLRRGPFRLRPTVNRYSQESDADPVQSSQSATGRALPPWPFEESSYDSSFLEYNSRARAFGLNGLRHRARPRSPSPEPVPRSPVGSFIDTYGPNNAAADTPDLFRGSSPGSWSRGNPYLYPVRSAADDEMLQMFSDRVPPPRQVEPESAPPSSHVPRITEDHTRPPRSVNFNLDAFRDGPFRATLARSVANQNARRDPPQTSERVERTERREVAEPARLPSPMDLWYSEVVEGAPLLTFITRRPEEAMSTSDHPGQGSGQPRTRTRADTTDPRPDATSPHNRSAQVLDEYLARFPLEVEVPEEMRPASNRGSSSSRSYSHSGTGYVFRAAETRSSSREDADRRAPLRNRTLLEREHASTNAPWADLPTTYTTSRLERVQRHRQMIQLMRARTREGQAGGTTSTAEPTQTSANQGSNATAQATILSGPRRYGPVPEEDRATFGGIFTRRRGTLGQAFPTAPDWAEARSTTNRFPRRRNFGDYMRDEDLDISYEGLLSLSSMLGDVKPRGTPEGIISLLPKGKYRDWVRPGATDERCPICLDDYQPDDDCLRLNGCSHWFHDGCLQQWLKTARTCPVCRGYVNSPRMRPTPPVAGSSRAGGQPRWTPPRSHVRAPGQPHTHTHTHVLQRTHAYALPPNPSRNPEPEPEPERDEDGEDHEDEVEENQEDRDATVRRARRGRDGFPPPWWDY